MTTRPTVSRAQHDALEAAAAGVLIESKRRGETYLHWRIEIDEDICQTVTRTAESLRARGLIAKGAPRADGSVPAVVTDAGRELLAELASREPARKDDDADPS